MAPHPALTHHNGHEAAHLLDRLSDAYADAYGAAPDSDKTAAFRHRALRQFGQPGFALVTATEGDQLLGFAFGRTLPAGDTHWWGGLQPEPPADFRTETGTRTWVLAEIEVRRTHQGHGLGRALHDAVLTARPEERATLATAPDAAVQAAYTSWGWQPVGRVPGADGEYYSAYDLFVLPLPLSP